jgi:hypothetical protein
MRLTDLRFHHLAAKYQHPTIMALKVTGDGNATESRYIGCSDFGKNKVERR